MSEIELDQELLADFIVESRELLDDYSANVMAMEEEPESSDKIGAVFRAAHTLKGSSAFFGLVHIKNFAHKLENLLDDVRQKRRVVTPEVIDILLTGGGHLQAMFNRLGTGDYGTVLTSDEDIFLNKLLAYLEAGPPGAAGTPEEVVAAIQAVNADYLKGVLAADTAMRQIDALLPAPSVEPARNAQEGAVPPAKGPGGAGSYSLNGIDLTEPLARAETLMSEALSSGALDDEAYLTVLTDLKTVGESNGLAALLDALGPALEDFLAIKDSGIGFDELLIGMMKEKLDQILSVVESGPAPGETPAAEEAPPEPEAASPAAAGSEARPVPPSETPEGRPKGPERVERKTMRIDEDKVDGFMNYVGELIVTSESFNYLQKMIESEKVNPLTLRAFKNANQAFRELSGDLQESLMEIRRVPIRGMLQKVSLMARERADRCRKK